MYFLLFFGTICLPDNCIEVMWSWLASIEHLLLQMCSDFLCSTFSALIGRTFSFLMCAIVLTHKSFNLSIHSSIHPSINQSINQFVDIFGTLWWLVFAFNRLITTFAFYGDLFEVFLFKKIFHFYFCFYRNTERNKGCKYS